MSTVRFLVSAAVATLAGVSLVACGSDIDEASGSAPEQIEETTDDSNVVFDFTEQTARTMPTQGVKEITLKAPESLEHIADDYNQYKLTHDITITATEPTDDIRSRDCAIQVTNHYPAHAIDEIFNGQWYLRFEPELYSEGELAEYDLTPADLDAEHRLLLEGDRLPRYMFSNKTVEDTQHIQDAGVSTEIHNANCATSPHDGSTESVHLRQLNPTLMDSDYRVQENNQSFIERFATVELRVMTNGDLHIADYEIKDYTQDSNGDWIAQ